MEGFERIRSLCCLLTGNNVPIIFRQTDESKIESPFKEILAFASELHTLPASESIHIKFKLCNNFPRIIGVLTIIHNEGGFSCFQTVSFLLSHFNITNMNDVFIREQWFVETSTDTIKFFYPMNSRF